MSTSEAPAHQETVQGPEPAVTGDPEATANVQEEPEAKRKRESEDMSEQPRQRPRLEEDEARSDARLPRRGHWIFGPEPPPSPSGPPVSGGRERILAGLGMQAFEVLEHIGCMGPDSVGKAECPEYQKYQEAVPSFEFMWKKLSISDERVLLWKNLELEQCMVSRRMVRLTNLARFVVDLFTGDRACLPDLRARFMSVFAYGWRKFTADDRNIYTELTIQVAVDRLAKVEDEAAASAVIDELLADTKSTVYRRLDVRHSQDDTTNFCNGFEKRISDMRRRLLERWVPDQGALFWPVSVLFFLVSQYVRNEIASNPDTLAKFGLPDSSKITPANSTATTRHDWTRPEQDNDEFLESLYQARTAPPREFIIPGAPTPPPEPTAEQLEAEQQQLEADMQSFAALANPPADSTNFYNAMGQALYRTAERHVAEVRAAQAPVPEPMAQVAPHNLQALQLLQQPYDQQPLAMMGTDDQGGVTLPPGQAMSATQMMNMPRANASKSTPARREGSGSSRKPWSKAEEDALMHGLNEVQGPHWSQILGLHGPNGTKTQALANRTQVQLKDKARNLKLYYLKQKMAIPHFLVQVTGELKTRAPNQALKREREEEAAKAGLQGGTAPDGPGQWLASSDQLQQLQIQPMANMAAMTHTEPASGRPSSSHANPFSLPPSTAALAMSAMPVTANVAAYAPAGPYMPVSLATSMPMVPALVATAPPATAPRLPSPSQAGVGFQGGGSYTPTRYTAAEAINMARIMTPAMAQEAQSAQRSVARAPRRSLTPTTAGTSVSPMLAPAAAAPAAPTAPTAPAVPAAPVAPAVPAPAPAPTPTPAVHAITVAQAPFANMAAAAPMRGPPVVNALATPLVPTQSPAPQPRPNRMSPQQQQVPPPQPQQQHPQNNYQQQRHPSVQLPSVSPPVPAGTPTAVPGTPNAALAAATATAAAAAEVGAKDTGPTDELFRRFNMAGEDTLNRLRERLRGIQDKDKQP